MSSSSSSAMASSGGGGGTTYGGPNYMSSSSDSAYKTPPLWEMNAEQLNAWFQTSPLLQAAKVTAAAAATAAANNSSSHSSSSSSKPVPDPLLAWKNITTAIAALSETTALRAAQQVAETAKKKQLQQQQQAAVSSMIASSTTSTLPPPPRKRAKTARSSSERSGAGSVVHGDSTGDDTVSTSNEMLLDTETAALLAAAEKSNGKMQQQQHVLHDPYRIWLHVPSRPYSSVDASFRVLGSNESNPIVVETNVHHHDHDHKNNKNLDGKKRKKAAAAQEEEEEVEEDDDYDTDIPATAGGKLAQLSVDGLLNAMAGVLGGVVNTSHDSNKTAATTDASSANANAQQQQQALQQQQQQQQAAASAFWRNMAVTWHRSLQFTIRQDILRTTPLRIQAMLAADLTQAEFTSIRKRIYDTVILGKKSTYNNTNMNFPDPEDEDSDDDDDVYDGSSSSANNNGSNDKSTIDGGKRKNGKKKTSGTAGTTTTGKAASAGRNNDTLHEIEKMKKCQTCGNNDQSSFVLDLKNGDVICSQCGTVVSESIMHEGSQFRKFEGEQDRNHHGDAANPLYSNAHNMSTTLSGVQMTSGAGHGGWRSGGEKGGGGKNYETILRNAHAYTELNVSQFGKTDRRTRTGYKDRQKREAFINMAHTGDALNLHEAVVQRAKELFAGFRDDRELVQQFKGVIAACLCEAFEQLSSQGQAILKQQQLAAAAGTSNNSNSTLDLADALDAAAGAQKKSAAESEKASGGVGNKKNNGDPALGLVVTSLSARAARRNELHNATMAGRGGILLDLTTVQQQNASCGGGGAAAVAVVGAAATAGGTTNGNGGAVVDKPAPSWDLEDCRSWLLDASRKVAQQWIQQRQVQVLSDDKKKPSTASTTAGAGGTSTTTTTTVGTIPSGTLEELEGQLVEHSFTLCEYLEAELSKSTSNKINSKAGHQQRVITPRVNNMAKLGIKWQHSHERGSGGKGGVGGSGKGKQVGGGSLATGAGTLPSRGNTNATAGGGGGKRAGQILILLTAKRLGSILNDTVSGEAIHKELRSVVGKQEARKLKERSEEASRQRLQQMQRKPWLQARAQMET